MLVSNGCAPAKIRCFCAVSGDGNVHSDSISWGTVICNLTIFWSRVFACGLYDCACVKTRSRRFRNHEITPRTHKHVKRGLTVFRTFQLHGHFQCEFKCCAGRSSGLRFGREVIRMAPPWPYRMLKFRGFCLITGSIVWHQCGDASCMRGNVSGRCRCLMFLFTFNGINTLEVVIFQVEPRWQAPMGVVKYCFWATESRACGLHQLLWIYSVWSVLHVKIELCFASNLQIYVSFIRWTYLRNYDYKRLTSSPHKNRFEMHKASARRTSAKYKRQFALLPILHICI